MHSATPTVDLLQALVVQELSELQEEVLAPVVQQEVVVEEEVVDRLYKPLQKPF